MNPTDRIRARHVAPIALFAVAVFTAGFTAGCAGDPPSCVGSQCDKDDKKDDANPPKPSDDPPELQDDDPTNDQANGETGSLDKENTFEHPGDLDGTTRDPFDILAQRAEEGPPEIRTRLHSCQKVTVATLRQILTQFGVDLEAEADGGPPTAGQLLDGGGNALGASNYGARASESLVWTAAGAAKMFDIYVQAAPEIIANAPDQAVCQVVAGTRGPELFDEEGACNKDAISCLIGTAATDAHVAICNSAVQSASDLEKGKSIAVASLLSAAHSCD